jgi:hypothetical protein
MMHHGGVSIFLWAADTLLRNHLPNNPSGSDPFISFTKRLPGVLSAYARNGRIVLKPEDRAVSCRVPETRTGAAVARPAPPHKGPTFAAGLPPSVGSVSYLISTGGEMCLFVLLLWCSAIVGRGGRPNTFPYHSRFGAFNSPVRLSEFPVPAATGIRSQRIDLSHCFRGQTAVAGGKSMKFPVRRENREFCTGAAGPFQSCWGTPRRTLVRRCTAKVIRPIAPQARLPRNDGGRLPRRT